MRLIDATKKRSAIARVKLSDGEHDLYAVDREALQLIAELERRASAGDLQAATMPWEIVSKLIPTACAEAIRSLGLETVSEIITLAANARGATAQLAGLLTKQDGEVH